MIHSTVIIHVPKSYWLKLHPNWCNFHEGARRDRYHEHIDEVQGALSLPGLHVHVMLVHKDQGEYEVQRVRIPWSYRLWWLLNGKKWMENQERRKRAAMDAWAEGERTRL